MFCREGEIEMIKRVSFAVAAIACLICPPATNAAEDITRTILQQADIPGSNYSAVLALAEIRPNVLVARHTHPGVEISYVLQGACDFLIEGKGKMHVKA